MVQLRVLEKDVRTGKEVYKTVNRTIKASVPIPKPLDLNKIAQALINKNIISNIEEIQAD